MNQLPPWLRWSFAAAGIVTFAGALVWVVFPREPSWHDRSLSSWLKDFDTVRPAASQAAADDALRHIGANALPALLSILRSHDSRLYRALLDVVHDQPFIELHLTSAPERHWRAVRAFQALGPIAKPALPSLVRMLDDPRTTDNAAFAIAGLRPEGVVALTAALTNQHTWVRRRAAATLGLAGLGRFDTHSPPASLSELRADAKISVPALLNSLRDQDVYVRARAAIALGLIGQEAETVVPALIDCLADSDASGRVRSAAAKALGRFGEHAAAAVPALMQAARSPNPNLSEEAAAALHQIDPALGRVVVH